MLKPKIWNYVEKLKLDIYRLKNENGRLLYKSEEELKQIVSDVRLIQDIVDDLEKILEDELEGI